ncbi:uncharacterized protein PHACADRAFT_266021 [Phanerochaete carnosa HHB-10118-sp]|uniref:Uncharacterized protein n=1 Tax=Phanerochaete carnosa (strain HHB-10118-sp) TaxID=650164 RepID=K5VCS7_PHACS|nr:uncharacterized protein PHACADRAFT_266021 [Phanerochaete carnosa HHB-10118-sp]EKM48883.1 hypothetical protein PHACADRAFT_266021 [Phanerochaete carnosa HHB-10118-sp]
MFGEPPIGALILATQAVERAFLAWRTGVKVLPDRRNQAEWFSADNWADYEVFTDGDRAKKRKIPRSSIYVKTMQRLKPRDWLYIVNKSIRLREETNLQAKRKKTGRRAMANEDLISDDNSDADFEWVSESSDDERPVP